MAAALEEIAAEVGHFLVHLVKKCERRGSRLTEVHRTLVDVAEDHLLIDVVDAAWIIADG